MRTTVELPDDLFRHLKAKAALEGVSVKELLTEYVEVGLREAITPRRVRGHRSPLPVIKRRGRSTIPDLTSELQARIEEEEDRAKLDRSFRR